MIGLATLARSSVTSWFVYQEESPATPGVYPCLAGPSEYPGGWKQDERRYTIDRSCIAAGIPRSRRVRRLMAYVTANPGCSLTDAARAVTGHRGRDQRSGYNAVHQALSSGLVSAHIRGTGPGRRYRLYIP